MQSLVEQDQATKKNTRYWTGFLLFIHCALNLGVIDKVFVGFLFRSKQIIEHANSTIQKILLLLSLIKSMHDVTINVCVATIAKRN